MKKVVLLIALVAAFVLCAVPAAAKTQETESAEGFVCDVCYFLVDWIEDKIASNKTETWIIAEVDKVCNIFPGFLGDECRSLVSYYIPQIIQSLENRFPPLIICSAIHLCTSLQQFFPAVDMARMNCAQCMFFSSLTYSATIGLTDPKAISKKLDHTCDLITDRTAKSMCKDFIKRSEVVELLARRTTPTDLCNQLGDCKPRLAAAAQQSVAERARKYAMEHPFRPVLTGASSTECQLCQWIFSAYQSWLSDAQTEAEIALFLSQLCNFFGSYAPQCNQLVRVYVPKVIQNYIERTTPPILCSSIGFCQLPIGTAVMPH